MRLNIKANTETTTTSTREALPEGWYHAVAIDAVEKRNSKDTGDVLILTFEIIEDEKYAGQWTWANFNVTHVNPQAVEIAEKQLSYLAGAAGIDLLTDSNQLLHRPVQILVKQREWNGETKNEIKMYKEANIAAEQPVRAAQSKSVDVPF